MEKRHSTFYFDETLVVLKVENVLFKVHKYHLVRSETFSDMFKVPQRSGDSVEGSTPEHPVVLDGVAATGFEALLTMLYARRCSTFQLQLTSSLITSAFRLAHMWNFFDLRSYLLAQAEASLSDAEKIVFAKKFSVRKWLAPAYLNLCRRSTPPTTSEATKLRLDDVVMIFRLRERYRVWDPMGRTNSSSSEKYCERCFGYSYHSPKVEVELPPSKFGWSTNTPKCSKCGVEVRSYFESNRSSELNSDDNSLEKEIEKWIEGGCEPE
ncbi:unnamed protein product [Rhizoctonia solani]|uniref:BTB domain-containing protein n=1 Tax=Rhizoctonia solani TaxID=456999 RepID=A0A8H3DFZ2_9AGAM|nr:unnamed protein product [Rhizoctonia solani]